MTTTNLAAVRRIGAALPDLIDALGGGDAVIAGLDVSTGLAALTSARLRALEAQDVRALRFERGDAGHPDPVGDLAADVMHSRLGDALLASERAVRRAASALEAHARALVAARSTGELAGRAAAVDAEHTLVLIAEGFSSHAAVLELLASRVLDEPGSDPLLEAPAVAATPARS